MKGDRGQDGERLAPASGAGSDRSSRHPVGFTDKAGHIKKIGEHIAQVSGLGAVGTAEPGGAFETTPLLVGPM
jgi:hypothetical protein